MTTSKYFQRSLRGLMAATALTMGMGVAAQQPDTPTSQMEHLDRGLVVMPIGSGQYFASWRLFGTDTPGTTFELLKNGKTSKKDIYQTTSVRVSGKATDTFQVVTLQNGVAVDTTAEVTPWSKAYLELHLDRPAKQNGKAYFPNDCSVGDVDGDGQYELFVKWDPENSKDNSNSGSSNPVIIDCYKLDGTKLWRVNLGMNIRAGAHYTQFMVYDFDGDGHAEMICKTAPGSMDGNGDYVSNAADDANILSTSNSTDYRNSEGRILSGPEYLTVFDGQTGKALHTIWYNPNRAGKFNQVDSHPEKSFWNDNYGNRADRHLACVAYLDGPDHNASAVMCRGYYTRAYVWAVDFEGGKLKHKWLHASVNRNTVELYDAEWNKTTRTYDNNTSGVGNYHTLFGNGNHNLSCGDVDGDGCDEIIWGSGAVDNDGQLLYSVGFGHGDAIHLGDLDPDRPGYELFDVHEESVGSYGADLHDARTGEVLVRRTSDRDTGRGLAADFEPKYRGAEFTYATQTNSFTIQGQVFAYSNPGMNFRIFWDGDEYEELFNNITVSKWDEGANTALGLGFGRNALSAYGHPASCNGTKATPNLTADLFGDWREEIVLWSTADSATLNIYTSAYATEWRVPTLMHDHMYRMGVAWENVAYNQPPHLGYYLPDYVASFRGISADDIYIGNIDISSSVDDIRKGKSSIISVALSNSVEIYGYQFDISLPQGISLVKDSNGDFEYSLSTRYTRQYNMRVSIARLSGELYRVRCYSLSNELIASGEGTIISLPIKADTNIVMGNYECLLLNNYCTLEEGKCQPLDDCSFSLKVIPFSKGDVNFDESVNVTDVMMLVDFIMAGYNPLFHDEVADVNNDSKVDVADVMLVVNMILSGESQAPAVAQFETCGLEAVFTPDNKVELRMNDMSQYTAFQMQVQMPADIRLLGIEMAEETTGHRLMTKEIGDGLYNVIVYSLNGENFKDALDGALLRLVTDSGAKCIEIKNIQFTNPSFETITFSDVTGTTGIEEISSDETDRVYYNLQGMPVKNPSHGVFIKDGEKILMK